MTTTIPFARVSLVREKCALPAGFQRDLTTPAAVALLYRGLIERTQNPHVEQFWVFCLDSKNCLLAAHQVSVGTLNSSLVHPREVFFAAVHAQAASIVVAHHHPSGDPTPSMEDRTVTERLRSAGTLLGIPLLDHVVVAVDPATGAVRHRSMVEYGV